MKEQQENRKKHRWSRVILIGVIVSMVIVTGYGWMNRADGSNDDGLEMREEVARKGDILIGFSADGQAEIPVVNLDFEIGGILRELSVSEKDEILEGQLLARLDDVDQQKQVQVAEINYRRSLLNVQQKEEDYRLNLIFEKQKMEDMGLKLAQLEMEYASMASLTDYYPQQELETKRLAVEAAELAYQSQKAQYESRANSSIDLELERINVENARIALEIAQDNLAKTLLPAPLNATVLNVGYKVGETVSTVRETGQTTADTSHFMVVTDSDKVEVVAPVSEIDLSKVSIGQVVDVVFEAYETETFQGTVDSIASLPRIDQSGLVTYDVRINVDEGIDRIQSGMTCTVDFILRQEKNVLVIPNRTVWLEDGVQKVTVKSESGEVENREIVTGLTDGRNVEVKSGLVSGEIILVK